MRARGKTPALSQLMTGRPAVRRAKALGTSVCDGQHRTHPVVGAAPLSLGGVAMSRAPCPFDYVDCDVPPGVKIGEWRRRRVRPPRSRWPSRRLRAWAGRPPAPPQAPPPEG